MASSAIEVPVERGNVLISVNSMVQSAASRNVARVRFGGAIALLLGGLACGDSSSARLPTVGELGSIVDQLRLTPVASGVRNPTFLTALPGSETLLVLEQRGSIRRIENGELQDEPFLDLSERVESGGEQGLLGLAFHPDFADNGRFYVHYSSPQGMANGDGVVSEFVRRGDEPSADPGSERRLLLIEQPYSNHNGGMLAFSPNDGYLYIGLGDGGAGGDPGGRAQNLGNWLGKLLRIDVDARDAGEYGIPAGNMTGTGILPEIWSYGWRNPWRFSFDSATGDLYAGDVGQGDIEEVDYEPSGAGGRNYGWRAMEGSQCFSPRSGCEQPDMKLPVTEYARDSGSSITGGYVYRGQAIPELRGAYLYADYESGLLGSLRIEGEQVVGQRDITASINPDRIDRLTSFGVDRDGEMYVLSQNGTVYRIDAD